MKHKIYKLTCPNGKIYIGQTKQDKLYRRWNYGCGYAANKELAKDISTYGWNNFQHEILEVVDTKEEAYLKEREYILQFKSNEEQYGYNKSTNYSTQVRNTEPTYTYYHNITLDKYYRTMAEAGKDINRTRARIQQAISRGDIVDKKYKFEKVILTEEEIKRLNL